MRKRKMAGLSAAFLAAVLVVVSAAGDPEEAAPVQTEPTARRDLASAVPGSGRIEPRRKVDISADISGRVTELAVEEGDWVDKGDLLLRIEPHRYQAAMDRVSAGLAQSRASAEHAQGNQLQAERELRRMQEVAAGGGFVSDAEMERVRTQAAGAAAQYRAASSAVAQAEASLSEVSDDLSKTTITAPMSGRVTRVNIQEGETAVVGTMNNPGSLLLTIADLSEMEAHVVVDETDVPAVEVGDRAMVRIDAYPRKVYPGRVVRIANSAFRGGTQESAGFRVVIALDEPPAGLRPELSASADVVTEVRRGVLSVPILALTVRGGRPAGGGRARGAEGVFVVRDSRAVFVPVEVGIAGEQHFEIRRGLRPGETVVAGPYEAVRSLKEGDLVRAEAPAAAPAGSR
ncbi:MAG TPA: efflux RND transporter periplasmic adaptor subunit [Longimicrobium sp.]|nr:efflux RND transporter periplasmic adaptor subunit [Longimicrobium sp.]